MERLLELYRRDELMMKIKEAHDKWKNHANKKTLHVANSDRDIALMKLMKKYIRIQNITLDCLNAVNFHRKEAYKLWLNIHRKCTDKNSFSITYKKEYIRRMSKIKNRVTFDRALDELIEKKMLFVEKDGTYFVFTPNLSFCQWDVHEDDIYDIKSRVEREISFYDEIIDNGGIF